MPIAQRAILGSLPAAAAFGAATLLIAACSGSVPGSAIPNAPPPNAAGRASTAAPGASRASGSSYTFVTLDDQSDPTFNQLLGINDNSKIAGYFGIGSAGHPNKGYTLVKPYGQSNYTNENFPGSMQTQVTAINNRKDTAGFWVDNKMVSRGFVEWNGVFTSYRDPNTGKGTSNQILGLNDSGIAVGFYADASGNTHGFTLNQATGKFKAVLPPGSGSVLATAINDAGDIAGVITNTTGSTNGFIEKNGQFSALQFPGGSDTQPFGINKHDQMVGSYLDGGGVMHGFLLSDPLTHAKWVSIDDPNGIGSTVINGLNDNGKMVGFYTDASGNTDGMLILP
jgi:hypothetical protein